MLARHDIRSFRAAEHPRSHNRRSFICEKQRGLPVAAIDARPQDRRHEPEDDRAGSTGLWFWIALGAPGVHPRPDRSEGILQRRVAIFQTAVHESNERNLIVRQRVADGRVATTRVPTQHSFLRQPHALQGFDALGKRKVLRKYLNHIRASPLIQNLALLAEKIRKGLTILAVADHSVCAARLLDPTAYGSAAASQWMLHSFVPRPAQVRH